jgi:predicted dithiol-disulfide oxidoreductase (DUF899 family)
MAKKVPKRRNALHHERFPDETPAYRTARNKLLVAEIDLRRRVEAVAALRRKLPQGGPVPTDYEFEEGGFDLQDDTTVRRVRLSELFDEGKKTLLAYSFMFGPNMPSPCSSCTSILDGLNGEAAHVQQRANLVVIAKSPIASIREFARSRSWTNLRLLSSAGNSYNRDYRGEKDGAQLPSLNVFVKRGRRVHHFYNTELLFVPPAKGQDGRHVDSIWPLWNLFDYTPEGRGTTWYPRLKYE